MKTARAAADVALATYGQTVVRALEETEDALATHARTRESLKDAPMPWLHTVQYANAGRARQPLTGFVQPRIEPEIVFKLAAPVSAGADTRAVLESTAWIAAGFEIVQSHFPDWKFAAADCTAAF